jgi:hypothetical protein
MAQSQTATDALDLVAFSLDVQPLSAQPLTLVGFPSADGFDSAVLVHIQVFVSLGVGIASPKTAHCPVGGRRTGAGCGRIFLSSSSPDIKAPSNKPPIKTAAAASPLDMLLSLVTSNSALQPLSTQIPRLSWPQSRPSRQEDTDS